MTEFNTVVWMCLTFMLIIVWLFISSLVKVIKFYYSNDKGYNKEIANNEDVTIVFLSFVGLVVISFIVSLF